MTVSYAQKLICISLLMMGTLFVSCQRNSGSAGTEGTSAPADPAATQPIIYDNNSVVINTPSNADTAIRKGEPLEGYSYNALPQADGTWGYEVLSGAKLVISQNTAPGLDGKGFPQKIMAAHAAELLIEKMKNGETSPTLTEKEVKKIVGK